MCVALNALDARVRVRGPDGRERQIVFDEFHRLAGNTPQIDTNLLPDELILSIDLPKSPYSSHSCYLKVRDRASYAFALVSVAAAVAFDGPNISRARLSLGGVDHKPWRAQSAEQMLIGKPLILENLKLAADEALSQAQPHKFNEFKVDMAKRAIVRAFLIAGGS
ncbi:MAG TPA: hypothetical protein VFE27_00060 [Acidobacteriaceae bacterium]|nr:hypothetical protein [Acidobacteriaceae bacterium]